MFGFRPLVLIVAASCAVTLTAQQPSNPRLVDPAVEARVEKLLNQMTLDEKIGQLVQYNDVGLPAQPAALAAANPDALQKVDALELARTGRLGSMLNTIGQQRTNEFQRAAVEKSRLHIPILFGADIIHGYRTVYPVPLGLAASFDPSLVSELCGMSAAEARTAGVRWFYSPMVDVTRDARWGRVTEGAGEDAYLGSAMARAYIRGYQGDDMTAPGRVAASVKHFAAYGAAEAGREYNTTDMSEITLRQVYLPPYQAAVEAGAATIMSAFNALNGVPASANPFLLNQVLRHEWGFTGFVVSDYTAVMELTHHGIALDAATATRKAFLAGVDVDMMSHYYDAELPELIRTGKVPMAAIDEAVRRVLRVKFATGLFEHPYAEGTEVTRAVDAHRPLVRRAAAESFVLLQNRQVAGEPLLPLASKAQRVALIGPLADAAGEMVGAWGGANDQQDVVTLRQALAARLKQTGGELNYQQGTTISGGDEAGFAGAVAAASKADLVVLALGESGSMSGEGGSRAHLDLPGKQEQLLEAVAATGKPCVLIVFSGRPLVLDEAAKRIPAIVEAWFPGTEAGNALADVLWGDVVPSGRLPMSFPRAVGQEPLYYNQFPTGRPADGVDLTHAPDGQDRFVSRYQDVENDALFPFGYGLSYTTFRYADVAVSRKSMTVGQANRAGATDLVEVSATVTNTGKRAATEVVQCYVGNRGASVEQPLRSLQGFERVTLAPGESRKVRFALGFNELKFYNAEARPVVEPTQYTVWVGGDARAEQSAAFVIEP